MSYRTFAGQDAEAGRGVSVSESACTAVSGATLSRLARAGWGLCHVPRQVQGHVLLCDVRRVQAAVPHDAGPEVL